ncbi:hypothetical protein POJ06DRAFT_246632 [Lipomyces tetrasporus]|uniref:Uncharacterized protein n=1 Tax=Lipomyces tetrasporus TaxID=54092 RepID=A0AAD7QX63_9ASCO|nr:uncharacterized protein POJ06DRAFT_246632 [Lipomyces tetrasporus]KAJ8103123.1 hypothetical protein POJ06DRAFT_246632 [Lipomyces tetrasporus]
MRARSLVGRVNLAVRAEACAEPCLLASWSCQVACRMEPPDLGILFLMFKIRGLAAV